MKLSRGWFCRIVRRSASISLGVRGAACWEWAGKASASAAARQTIEIFARMSAPRFVCEGVAGHADDFTAKS